ncbi:MAG: hypothetical protein LM566_01060 [Pyrobaculum sp.]|jgi:hypothetical protein|nr:hypothetical protein [Pyrobaculum sp.]
MVDIEKVLRLLGLKIDELTPCDIYINYFMRYIADIEREIYNIKSKISYLEERCFTNIKEINK